MPTRSEARYRTVRAVAISAALLVLALVIWIDVRTGIWQELVILSGIAAGLVTFLLTALFLDKALARAEHTRWLPVTRLALTDLLHTLAHDDSHLGRGEIVPRRLSMTGSETETGSGPGATGLEDLLAQVVAERNDLTEALARWAAFLAASADVQTLLDHLAALAVHLDDVRDAALEAEDAADGSASAALEGAVRTYNRRIELAIGELRTVLDALAKEYVPLED